MRFNKTLISKSINKFFKFTQVGVFITFISLLLSFFFLKIIKTPLISTYVILYVVMIIFSFILNSYYTFKTKATSFKLLLYFGSYGISMLLGVFLLSFFRRVLPFENWILAYFVIPFTMFSNFMLSVFLFKVKK